MIVNGVDVREYGAKLLTVEEQPPKINVQKEMIPRALLPTEYQTDIPLGTLKLTIYFRARTGRNFSAPCRGSCCSSASLQYWKKSKDTKGNTRHT